MRYKLYLQLFQSLLATNFMNFFLIFFFENMNLYQILSTELCLLEINQRQAFAPPIEPCLETLAHRPHQGPLLHLTSSEESVLLQELDAAVQSMR